ncbi:MAG: AMP-binding protein, partial [bacterium]
MTQALWMPSDSVMRDANMTRFLDYIRRECDPNVHSYASLYQWSVEHPEDFWPQVWAFCGIHASHAWDEVLVDGDRMPGAKWFTGARLNFAENLLRYRDERTALVFRCEHDDKRITLTYRELYAQVARLADALRRSGVQTGDRVAGFMPNRPETIIAMLAATSIGAIWSSCSPDFGINGVLDRFGQIEPKVLVCADGYLFGGKQVDSLGEVRTILERLPTESRVVVVPYLNENPDLTGVRGAETLDELVAPFAAREIDFEPVAFNHPLYILYSSGTTGVPKCIVHGAGGTLLKHLCEQQLHS